MEIIKIVLTGGPCAGKTTALNSIKEYLREQNIPVFTIPETATELILNYIMPLDEKTTYNFQRLVLKKQLSKEQITEEYIRNIKKPTDKCVIIYDRGIIDNKAYLNSKDDFTKLLGEQDLTEIEVLDSYDLVLNLLSVASCKPKAYNFLNEARMEDVSYAIKLDEKTSRAWAHHRNLKIINSSVSIEEETEIILNYIKEIVENRQTKEVRKFLLDDRLSTYELIDKDNSEELYITDYHLDINDNHKYLVSKREYKNGESYIFRVYDEKYGKTTVYREKQICKAAYFDLIRKYNVIDKTTRKQIDFVENKQKYSICFYEDYTTLELEENKLNNELLYPYYLVIKEEITKSNKNVKVKELK